MTPAPAPVARRRPVPEGPPVIADRELTEYTWDPEDGSAHFVYEDAIGRRTVFGCWQRRHWLSPEERELLRGRRNEK